MIRVIGAIRPAWLAIHGGAAGYSAYVIEPRERQRRDDTTNPRNRCRSTFHSTAASSGVAKKCVR